MCQTQFKTFQQIVQNMFQMISNDLQCFSLDLVFGNRLSSNDLAENRLTISQSFDFVKHSNRLISFDDCKII